MGRGEQRSAAVAADPSAVAVLREHEETGFYRQQWEKKSEEDNAMKDREGSHAIMEEREGGKS
ncbi:hypothetical protein ACLOJK_005358 [Asimina triloba]